jgi:predicted DsbA family dithiol-disulfide isomerase
VSKGISAYKQKYPGTEDEFEINWEPFLLDPDGPRKGITLEDYISSKYGPGMLSRIEESQEAIGRENGIVFKKGGKVGSTKDSHRLIQFAGTKSKEIQSKVVSEIYAGYFEKAQDITSQDFLVSSAVAAGIDKKEAKDYLKSGRGEEEVESKVAKARAQGVKSVPNITVADKYDVGGKRDPESFVKLFETAKEKST